MGLLSRADGVSGTDARDEEDASSRLLVGCHRPFKKKDLSGVENRAGGGHREREPPRLPLAGAGAGAAFQDPAHKIVQRPGLGMSHGDAAARRRQDTAAVRRHRLWVPKRPPLPAGAVPWSQPVPSP